jgi:hypothetical protein
MGSITAQPSGSGGANKALSNLAGVAINAALIPDSDGTRDLGASATAWGNVYTKAFRPNIVTKTGAYTATSLDHTILCDASGGAFPITLPAAATVTGIIYYIKKIDSSASNVTIDGDGADIDGDPTAVITTQNESLMIQSDGSSWYIL